jgi:hypothetical protein
MRGYSFFAEMPEERKSKAASKAHPFCPWTRETLRSFANRGLYVNIIAVAAGTQHLGNMSGNKRDVLYDCVSALQDIRNSNVTTSSCTNGYLRKRAVRVDEELARKLHPALFDSGLL